MIVFLVVVYNSYAYTDMCVHLYVRFVNPRLHTFSHKLYIHIQMVEAVSQRAGGLKF